MRSLLKENMSNTNKTPFQRVAELNEAFGNAEGNSENIDWGKVQSQCKNIFDEYCELLEALGYYKGAILVVKALHERYIVSDYLHNYGDIEMPLNKVNTEAVRDALCDIQVFAKGAQHMMGYDGDCDMHDVIDGVFTRFIKDDADAEATVAMHAAKGVSRVYFEGEYPKMVMKSAVDQPDAPKGKVLKSASFKNTVFRKAPNSLEDLNNEE